MIVLLDEAVPHALRLAIKGHEVSTTVYRGWGGLRNGKLIAAAEEAGVQVFVTCDQEIPAQQNLKGRKLGVVVLSKQEWRAIQVHLAAIQKAIDECLPGSVTWVNCG